MTRVLVYLFLSIVLGVLSYKCYSIGYGKKLKNSFANYIFISSLIIALASFKSAIMVAVAIHTSDNDVLFWSDLTGRALFYMASIFSIQIPLYKYYPNDKRRFIFSFIALGVAIALIIYQLINKNQPSIDDNGIINFNADMIMIAGMAYLLIIPWAATSYIFIREYVKGKFISPKPLLIGAGSLLITLGAIFQDVFSITFLFVLFSIILAAGFLLVLAGIFYEE